MKDGLPAALQPPANEARVADRRLAEPPCAQELALPICPHPAAQRVSERHLEEAVRWGVGSWALLSHGTNVKASFFHFKMFR